MARRKLWSTLARKTRDRYADQAYERYGLSRRSAREMYNRGTWRPGSPDLTVPRAAKRQPERYRPPSELRARALANFVAQLGHYIKFNIATVTRNIYDHASLRALRIIIGSDDDDLTEWAHWQTETAAPEWIAREGWWDQDGDWHNLFW